MLIKIGTFVTDNSIKNNIVNYKNYNKIETINNNQYDASMYCLDLLKPFECEWYSQNGYCNDNYILNGKIPLTSFCQLSCKKCCGDTQNVCILWSIKNLCNLKIYDDLYVFNICAKSCNLCSDI